MARRVNTKFLISLVTLLVMAVALSGGVYWWMNVYRNNPTRLIASAQRALKAGNVDAAISYYQRAAIAAEKEHLPTAAQMSMQLGDLYYANTASNPERYAYAISNWENAVQINPRLLPAQLRLLNVTWKLAKLARQRAEWQSLQKIASTVIELDPKNARAWRLRAAAELGLLSGLSSISHSNFSQAKHDLTQACKLAPQNYKPFQALATIYLAQASAELKQNLIGPKRAAKLVDTGLNLMLGFVRTHPKDALGWIGLANVYRFQPDGLPKAEQAMATATKLAPTNRHVVLARVNMLLATNAKPAAVILSLQRLIAVEPNSMQNYLLLGQYQMRLGQAAAAVKTLLAGMHHPSAGQGLTPLINRQRRLEINQELTDAYLQLAGATASGSVEHKAYVLHAADSLAWVKQHQPVTPWVMLYTGRLRFLQGRPDEALRWLKKAAGVLSPENPADLQLWFRDHQWQSQVYASMNQSGAALAQLDQINAVVHGQPLVLLDRASLSLAQDPAGALADAQRVLKAVPGNLAAITIEAKALAALNRVPELRKLLAGVDTSGSLELALLKSRLDWLDGHYHRVLTVMAPWRKAAPGDSRIVLTTYAALAALHERTEASKLFDAAIKAEPNNVQFLVLSDQLANPKNVMPKINFAGIGSDVLGIVMPVSESKNAQLKAIKRLRDPFIRDITLFNYYLGAGHRTKANAALTAAAKLKPNDSQVVEAQFSLALAAKNYKQAKAVERRAVDGNLDGANGATYRARLAIAQNDLGAAVKVLRSALRDHPYNTTLRTYYGDALLLSGDIDAGIRALHTALASAPDDIAAIKALVKYDLARPSQASIENAVGLINQGLAYQPLDSELNHWNNSLADLYGPPAPAIARREKLLKSDPGDIQNIMRLGLLYSRNNQPNKAIALLKKAWKANPTSLPLAEELGSLYSRNNHFSAAANLYGGLAESKNATTALAARLLLGDLYETQGNIAQATQLYKSAQKIEPAGTQVAQRRLGDMYFNIKHFNKALGYYGPLFKARPKDRTVQLRYIETLIRAGQPAKGLALLDADVFAKNQKDEAGLELKGLAFRRQGHLNKSIQALNQALALNPNDTRALESRAEDEMALPGGKLDRALADLALINSLVPNDLQSRLQTAAIYNQQGHFARAVQEYRTILNKVAPKNPTVEQLYANLLFNLSVQFVHLSPNDISSHAASLRTINPVQRLHRLLLTLTAAEPRQPAWWILRARLDLLEGRKSRAMTLARRAYLADNRGSMGAADYGQILNAGGEWSTALKISTKALALAPGFVPLYLVRAQANVGLKNWPEGTRDYTKALDLSLSNSAAFLDIASNFINDYHGAATAELVRKAVDDFIAKHPSATAENGALAAILAFKQARYSEALTAAKSALAANPPAEMRNEMLRTVALSAYELQQYPIAKKYYREILAATPDDASVLNNLAYLLAAKLKDPVEALHYAEKANRLQAHAEGSGLYCNDPNLLDTLGWARFLNKDYTGAYNALHHALRFNPPAAAYYHLARVLVAQKRDTEAIRFLEKAIAMAEKNHLTILARAELLLKSIQSTKAVGG